MIGAIKQHLRKMNWRLVFVVSTAVTGAVGAAQWAFSSISLGMIGLYFVVSLVGAAFVAAIAAVGRR